MNKTSWEPVHSWYHKIVGHKGHYYHQKVILPKVLRLLSLSKNDAILDLACGQGILERHLPKNIFYTGIDISSSLIKEAKKQTLHTTSEFLVHDVTQKLPIKKNHFSHAISILALQNILHPEKLLQNAAHHLKDEGKLLLVLNHPCFRIPRQSSWGIDSDKKIQYRRIDRYMTSMKIPIQAHPGKKDPSQESLSFHFSLSQLSQMLFQAGFQISLMEEWCSDKTSTGKAAKMENLSRKEFPLFLCILAKKS